MIIEGRKENTIGDVRHETWVSVTLADEAGLDVIDAVLIWVRDALNGETNELEPIK